MPTTKMTWASSLSAVRWLSLTCNQTVPLGNCHLVAIDLDWEHHLQKVEKAEYDTGKKDSIGKKWRENPAKGNKAKIYDQNGEWIGEWVGGQPATYFYGKREDKERTQWMAGNGDGMLVWDHNGNGIIDDNTEMMSEYNVEGKAVFANGFEKLAHYFDIDKNGVITAQEFKGLRLWVDDGDAVTEAGELQTLPEHGITEIKVPTDHSDFVGDYTKEEMVEITETGSAQREGIPEDPVEDDNQEEDTTPTPGIEGTLTLASVVNFILVPEKDPAEKAIQQIDEEIVTTKEDQDANR